ncbi:glycosyltransferase [Labilibacter marinus]|uniref:glycosyltransferase n=1 Tax=Labilibacter marinus TaxID=1477105 RepID=UPI00094F8850|nr:glycosyltransferase [Labilibacter marinus]
MKVLQLCGKDFFGAGRAAYRLHKGLLNAGVDSVMWVGAKRTKDDTVIDIQKSNYKKKLTKVYVNLEKLIIKGSAGGATEMFSLGYPAHGIRKKIEHEKPDLIHIHWINRGFFNLRDLQKLNIPIVISLHDMWWYTGGCHYDEECGAYVRGCESCPVLKKDAQQGLSYRQLRAKKGILQTTKHLTFIGLSAWMKDCVSESLIGKEHQVVGLPNGIDTNKFKPLHKDECREKLGLPKNKKLIMFAAVDVLSESRKGYRYISEALKKLNNDKYELVVIGEKSQETTIGGLKTYFLGEINDDQLMIEYMSSVDVAVVPSLQENLSNLIMESLSCGTPVVAFKIGGNGDMIQHQKNGYLAEDKNVTDLAKGIEYCTIDEYQEALSNSARQNVLDHFNIRDIAPKYIDLYQSIIKNISGNNA